MTLDIRGAFKSSKVSSNRYVVFEELVSNAIDSFLIRKRDEPSVTDMEVIVEVAFQPDDMLEDQEQMSIACRDNGCGMGDDQVMAFVTRDTSYKDDLSIDGIGQCKGSGRLQYFLHFSRIKVASANREAGRVYKRQMTYAEPQKEIKFSDFVKSEGSNEDVIGTRFDLQVLRDLVRDRIARGEALSSLFSAQVLKKQMLMTFLQRLVSLDKQLGEFEIKFVTRHWKSNEQCESLKRSDLPKVTRERLVDIEEVDPRTGTRLGTSQQFKLSHYKLDALLYDIPKNAISFCAKSSPVRDITPRYLRTRAEQNNSVGGFYHIVLIEGDFLDRHVNEQRDEFENIPEDIPSCDLFSQEKLSYAAIYAAIDPLIDEMVSPASWDKERVITKIAEEFGISATMIQDTSTRILYGDTPQSVAERVLAKYQEQIVDETAQIFRLKEEIFEAKPDSDDFREKINELAWKYTASLKRFDMANLSQLIVRRLAIVQVLELACNRKLAMQNLIGEERRKDERIIHSIFFPMRKDTSSHVDHDIWLLSEEYHYYDYIASDLQLANIKWKQEDKLFASDVDEAFESLLAKRAHDNGAKRPDIALFHDEGSAIIVEFKAPGVSMDDHVGDLSEYAHLLAAKSNGRLRKFYCYLIGDTVNRLRLNGPWTSFPTGKGWFMTSPLNDPTTRQNLGETYFEILHYSDVIDRAKKRIGVYQEKLKLDLQ